jgi:uncharacterized membrane protein
MPPVSSPVRHLKAHFRLLIGLGAGIAAGALLSSDFAVVTRILFGWNIGIGVFLVLTWHMLLTAGEARLRQQQAAQQDEPRTIILAVMVAAVLASLGGTAFEVHVARTASGAPVLMATALCVSTVILSWLFMHTLFAVHYAHEYYGDRGDKAADHSGLAFPRALSKLGYPEFIYMSFCVGMTYQVSDMAALNRKFRWLITVHGCLSFFYNTFILALVVNYLSGLGNST